ncbi:MAG TPA: glycosyltransferase [Candidatus Angelobacter sp.]|jgi:cellulose synthase/poly-beta-1,6-N-acetylglucosamine synthase-like glycosyltransferase|nr:glycosyltransferase [Candidatus Angelobacter sp.]
MRETSPRSRGRLADSIDGLRLRFPDMSASTVLSSGQRRVLATAAVLLVFGFLFAPIATLVALNGVVAVLYTVVLVHNVRVWRRIVHEPTLLHISDAEARAIPDCELPVYSVMVAAYREQQIIGETLRALEQLDYPRDRLEVMLLLEADDKATIAAARAANPAANVAIVLVPSALPRTKPKALNYGLPELHGEFVTVYDAEDRPDPLQLRKAALAFSRAAPEVACLQARLEYHNAEQNRITRWFAVEYLTWFARMLPAIASVNTPVPLGGTSMHIRRSTLEHVGGWDPHNVTEDCDLGIRLYRMGYRTQILDSATFEEANSDFVNWVKQRSRWYKGFIQTWLVHMRHPVLLHRQLGASGFAGFNVLVGATSLVAVLNPVFWLLTGLWFLAKPAIVQMLFPDWIYFPGLVSMLFGNFLAFYAGLLTVRAANRPDLLRAVLSYPFYWAMMSLGAVRACIQLVAAPFVWEKTLHGLDRPVAAVEKT